LARRFIPAYPARELAPSLPALTTGAIRNLPAQPSPWDRLENPTPDSRRTVIICRQQNVTTEHWGASVTRDNILYLIIGALVIVTAVLSYQLYQDHKQPEGMRIDLGPNGLSIEKK
jgi:hypothetical protein